MRRVVSPSTPKGSATRTKFEQPVAEGPRMRHPHVRTVLGKQIDQPGEVRDDVNRPRLDLVEHTAMEVLDLVGHKVMLA